mgnify:CR=1 FL=1
MKTISNKYFITYVILLSMAFSSLASAGGRNHKDVHWANVTRVEPIMRTVERRVPEERCWNEQVEYYDKHRDRGNSYTSTIMGGIIGGALGNAVGHKKKNKQIGTAVGAILGASIGSELSSNGRRHNGSTSRYRTQQHCEVTYQVSYENEILDYHVWYRYKGEEYKTRMSYKPGKKIKVRVRVDPI